MTPTIGITTSLEEITCAGWNESAAIVGLAYTNAVERAGGRPLALVPNAVDAGNPEAVIDLLDGLILSGGLGDIDPAHYGQERDPATHSATKTRDSYELSLARAALEQGLPVLGICRGMQVLNVARGGTLTQHLDERSGHWGPPGSYLEHDVTLTAGSLAARSVGAELTTVRSYHHQGVAELGDGFLTTGLATTDRATEAIEDPSLPFALGVLWHPEEDLDGAVISALVRQAERGSK